MTINELKGYEVNQYRKAFADGTDKAWKQYRINVKKMVKKFEKETGYEVDIDALMA